MATTVKNGWHELHLYHVYVKNGKVTEARDWSGARVQPAHWEYPYENANRKEWVFHEFPISFITLKNGVARGTWELH